MGLKRTLLVYVGVNMIYEAQIETPRRLFAPLTREPGRTDFPSWGRKGR